MGRLMLGLFLALTVLSPWTRLSLQQWESMTDELYSEAQSAAQAGKLQSSETLGAIIKEKCEAYILDKARLLHLDIAVQVQLGGETVPSPTGVVITGGASPYARQRLQAMIQEELGIPKENQQWT